MECTTWKFTEFDLMAFMAMEHGTLLALYPFTLGLFVTALYFQIKANANLRQQIHELKADA